VPAAVLRAVLAQSWRRPGRQLLVGLVIVVATAFAATSLMLTDSARTTIMRELAGTPQAAALVVLPVAGSETVPADVEQQVRDVPGVAGVASSGTGTVVVSLPGSPGDGEPWTALAAVTGPLSRHPLVKGRLPADPEAVAISEETARRAGLDLGDPLSLVGVDGDEEQFVVSGVVRVRLQVLNTVLMQPAVTARLTGADPAQLDVLAAPGVAPVDLAPRVVAAAGDGARVVDGDDVRAGELGGTLGGVEGIFAALAVFGATAVLAAALTTSCVFGVVTGRQRHTVALLRRVGAGRGQVLRALLVDAGLTGLAAGVLGVLLSLGLVELVRIAIRVGLGEDLPSPGIPLATLLACVAGAVVTTLLAAVGPAVQVSGERPTAIAGEAVRSQRFVPRVVRVVTAVVLVVASTVLTVLGAGDPQSALLLVAGAVVLAFGAVLAAGPLLLPAVAWLLGAVLGRLSGLPGRLAGRSVLRAPDRASTTAAALVLSGLLLSVVLVGLQSITLSVQDRIASQFPAPVTAQSAGREPLPGDLAARLRDLVEVGAVATVESASMEVGDGTEVGLTAVDVSTFPPLLDGALDAGSLADLVPGTVALDRAQAATWQVGVGSRLRFAAPSTQVELAVVAVYRSSGILAPVTVHPLDLPRIVPDGSTLSQLLVIPAGAVEVETLREAVAAAVEPGDAALVRVPDDARVELENAVRLTSAVALGLVAATVLVAVCGVAVALALAVRERHRESTTMRALGLTPAQVVAALGVESTLLGLAGVLVGTALGVLFGVLSVQAIGERPVVPVDSVLACAGVLVLVAAVAGTLPALRAARRRPLPSD